MEHAEKIAFEDYDSKKLAVISGIGVRDWFYELGYNLDGYYVSKPLID
jgi:elongator complex protein 3